MLRRLKSTLQHWSKRFVTGEHFKRYTRPNPAAEPGIRQRIALCYLITSLGDIVMLFVLLDALRLEHPDVEILAFVDGSGTLLADHPAITEVHKRPPRARISRHLWPLADIVSLWRWWHRDLRGQRFDLCILPRGGVDPFYSAHLAWLLGGRRRVGYTSLVEPERIGSDLHPSPLLTDEVLEMSDVHEIQRGAEVLQLAGLLPGPIDLTQTSPSLLAIAHSDPAQRFVRSKPELSGPYFVISPVASVRYREWPVDAYAAVAQNYAARAWTPVIVGGPEVRPAAETISAKFSSPVLNLAGETDFSQLAAVLAGARCFFGSDSGTGHLAGALGTPVVIISSYALTSPASHQISPQRSRPAGPWQAILQPQNPLPPCGIECGFNRPHCITQIPVSEVLAAADALLARAQLSPEVASVAR
jgi:ADP-heptose:LPS heptosyltransferase